MASSQVFSKNKPFYLVFVFFSTFAEKFGLISEKYYAQDLKKHPNGAKSPHLVTLMAKQEDIGFQRSLGDLPNLSFSVTLVPAK